MNTWEDFTNFIKNTDFEDCDEVVIDTVPPLKYHIYNEDKEPLCWDGQIIDFDDYDSAHEFLLTVEMLTGNMYEPYEIERDLLFYDGGHINLTNYIPKWNEPEGDELILVKREKHNEDKIHY